MTDNIFRQLYKRIPKKYKKQLKPIYNRLEHLLHKLVKINSINIGGGPGFFQLGWLNLEEVRSNNNPIPFKLNANCIFPVKNSSINTVYTSHCLEHLNKKTLHRILNEVFRVIKYNGDLIIKIPDYDRALEAWRNNNSDFFQNHLWDFESVIKTWKSRNVKVCFDNKAAMIFCGFWNDEYGDHFSNQYLNNETAYHGPPVRNIGFYRSLIKTHTPSEISAELRKIVVNEEKTYHFNHQNAWSRKELKELLISKGFTVKSFDKELIIANFKDVPDISNKRVKSMYCWAGKTSSNKSK